MNLLEIIVLAVLAVCILIGYWRGFLKSVYSIAAWCVVLAFVTFATPALTDFLEKNTGLKDAIQEKCADYLEHMAEEKITEEGLEQGSKESSLIPDEFLEEFTGTAAAAIGGVIAESGVYDELAEQVSHFIIEGIAFFLIMTVSGFVTLWISRMLNFVSKIPVIKGPDKLLGAVAGGLKGLLIVWLLFYLISLCAASEFGTQYLLYIEESPFLKVLYENNLLLMIIMKLVKK